MSNRHETIERMKTNLENMSLYNKVLWRDALDAYNATDNDDIHTAIDRVVSEHHEEWKQLRDKIQQLEKEIEA